MDAPSLPGDGLKVLLIDGNAMLADAVRQVLQQSGMTVDVATTGQQAQDYILREPPVNVVVLDARVGDTDGHDILNYLRSDPRWKLVIVVMMTSLDGTHDVRRARKAGADDYLFKPVRPERLVEHVLRMATAP